MRIGFELFEMAKSIMIDGIKAQSSNITPEEVQQEIVRRMMRCHSRNSLRRSLYQKINISIGKGDSGYFR